MSKIDEVQSTVKNTPGLGKKMAKYGAIGAVVAIPVPFVGPVLECAGRRRRRLRPPQQDLKDAFDYLCVARSAAMKTARKDSRPTEDGRRSGAGASAKGAPRVSRRSSASSYATCGS